MQRPLAASTRHTLIHGDETGVVPTAGRAFDSSWGFRGAVGGGKSCPGVERARDARVRRPLQEIRNVAAGVAQFVEYGGKVLAPMVKRSAAGEVEAASVISMDDIEALLKTL